MAKNQVFTKKKNADGTDFICPDKKDFIMVLVSEEIVPDEIIVQETLEDKATRLSSELAKTIELLKNSIEQ